MRLLSVLGNASVASNPWGEPIEGNAKWRELDRPRCIEAVKQGLTGEEIWARKPLLPVAEVATKPEVNHWRKYGRLREYYLKNQAHIAQRQRERRAAKRAEFIQQEWLNT